MAYFKPRFHRFDALQRWQILNRWKKGQSMAHLAKAYKCGLSTISRLIGEELRKERKNHAG